MDALSGRLGHGAGESLATGNGSVDLTIPAIVEKGRERKNVAAGHSTIFPQRRRVSLAVADPTGLVGCALLRLIEAQESKLRDERNLELSIVGAINTKVMTWNERGIGAGPEVTARGILADIIHAALDTAAERT